MKLRFLFLSFIIVASACVAYGRQPQRGFRGFVESINDVKADIAIYGGPTDSRFYTGVALSQGYQFNTYLFVGGGISVEQCVKDNKIYSAPVFAHLRSDLKFGRFTPFIDVRVGYNFANYGGIYFSPTIGYRINWGRRFGLNIGVGWTMNGNRDEVFDITIPLGPDGSGGTNTISVRKHQFDNTLSLRLGIDF